MFHTLSGWQEVGVKVNGNQRHSEFWEEKPWERFSLLQFSAAVACKSAEILSTCFPAAWFSAALQNLTFSDCCPQLS